VLAMESRSSSPPSSTATEEWKKTRYEKLVRAAQVHSRLTRKAITGKGVDRHLMALSLVYKQETGEGEELPELVKDQLFDKSKEWKLSTSGLSAGERFVGTG
jgi:carnitine O-acetyltransferase